MTKATNTSAPDNLRPEIARAIASIKRRAEKTKPDPYGPQAAAFLAGLVADIDLLMEDRGVSQAELARRLGCSEARISKLLGGSSGAANMTAATIARIMAALGEKVAITSPRMKELKGENQLAHSSVGWAKICEAMVSSKKDKAVVCNENQRLDSPPRQSSWNIQSVRKSTFPRLTPCAA